MYLANRDFYFTGVAEGGQQLGMEYLAMTFPDILFFPILYALAIFYKRDTALHMRFMISTAFLFILPALDRAFSTYLALTGFEIGLIFILSLVGIITFIDSFRTKRISPFLLVFVFLLLAKVCWELRTTPFWQAIGKMIVKVF